MRRLYEVEKAKMLGSKFWLKVVIEMCVLVVRQVCCMLYVEFEFG